MLAATRADPTRQFRARPSASSCSTSVNRARSASARSEYLALLRPGMDQKRHRHRHRQIAEPSGGRSKRAGSRGSALERNRQEHNGAWSRSGRTSGPDPSSASSTVTLACSLSAAAAERPPTPPPTTMMSLVELGRTLVHDLAAAGETDTLHQLVIVGKDDLPASLSQKR
jgi:hypothetical protein